MLIAKNSTFLFQGDSITWANRLRLNPKSMGNGYASTVSSWINSSYAEYNIEFFNRGVYGNTSADLVQRWQKDCIELKPDWVCILIGINDCSNRYKRDKITTTSEFYNHYCTLLDMIKQQLPDCKIILMQPFVLHTNSERKRWRDDLNNKIITVNDIAKKYDTYLIELDQIFQKACEKQLPEYWAEDGVHPSKAGASLIAQQLLKLLLEEQNCFSKGR